jgi:competence protein ComEC
LTSSSRPINKPEFSSPDPQASFLEIQLTQDPIERAKTFKSEAVILRYVNDTIHVSGEPILVYLPKSETPKYGDRYLLTSQLVAVAPPTNPDAFNYKRYLYHHHIRNQLFIRENHIIRKSSGHGHPILSQTSRWRRKASDKLVELGIQGDELAIINALLLGQKELLTESITKAYSGAGAMHVLAVSGLHVGIVLLLLNTLLKPMEASKCGRVS